MGTKLARKLKQQVNLRRVVGLYRRRLSRTIFARLGGIVTYGPFAGMRWLDNPKWGRSEQGVMLLGLYEQEVAASLVGAPERFRVFVDVGAADGFYTVGLLHSGRVDSVIAFETLPESREAIRNLAAKNGVAERIRVLGTASDHFVNELVEQEVVSSRTMFLFDIEGAEFSVLTAEVFAFLRDSMIIVETHAHIFPDPEAQMSRLAQMASKTHKVTSWIPGARNPWVIKELNDFTEIDRWILCSEGRVEVQQWLRFDPL